MGVKCLYLLRRSTTIFCISVCSFVRINTRIVLFPGYAGGEKPTLPGNEGICTGTSDDTFGLSRALARMFTLPLHISYRFICKHVFFKDY